MHTPTAVTDKAIEYAPKLVELSKTDDRFKKVIEVARSLEGLYRQAGMHAGGVVIGDQPLVEYVPCFSGNNGELVTQFDKDKVEAAGLVKFDFLGLKTLDVIESAEALVNARIARENTFELEEKDRARKGHPHAMRVGPSAMPCFRWVSRNDCEKASRSKAARDGARRMIGLGCSRGAPKST